MYHKEVNSQDIRNFPKILEQRVLEPSFRTPGNKFFGERGWGIPNPSKLCPSNDRAIISTIVVKSFSDLHQELSVPKSLIVLVIHCSLFLCTNYLTSDADKTYQRSINTGIKNVSCNLQ